MRTVEEFYRDHAVEIVDFRHGYTTEFSPDPAAHAAEYDRLMEYLLAEYPVIE